MPENLLFVYGTLRREFANTARTILDDCATYLGKASVNGKLYEINGYPGLILSNRPENKVFGELYTITDSESLLNTLDDYEGCSARYPQPREFKRKKVPATLQSGKNVRAWVYLYNWDLTGKKRIPSGDYLQYVIENGNNP